MDKGILYLVATPIGNLDDITVRALNTLKTVDMIACEDTRHSLKLFNHFDIAKPLTSYHEHNKQEKGEYLVQKLLDGENIALVTDAGTPAISSGTKKTSVAGKEGLSSQSIPTKSSSIL